MLNMLLSEILEQLSFGELNHLYIGGSDYEAVQLEHFPKIINHINLGLIELYKRFNLKLREVNLLLSEDTTTYELDSRYAVTNPYSTDDLVYPKYVIDTASNPFTDDLLKVDVIKDSEGTEIPLDDESDSDSVISYSTNIFKFVSPVEGDLVTFTYRASPTKLDIELENPSEVHIELPNQFMEAMLNYIGHRTFLNMSGENSESVNYYSKFEASCALIRNRGLYQDSNTTNRKLTNNGWV